MGVVTQVLDKPPANCATDYKSVFKMVEQDGVGHKVKVTEQLRRTGLLSASVTQKICASLCMRDITHAGMTLSAAIFIDFNNLR